MPLFYLGSDSFSLYQILPALCYFCSRSAFSRPLGKRREENPEEELDQIYIKTLPTPVGGEDQDAEKGVSFDLLIRVVGSITIIFDPPSITALGSLLGVSAPKVQQTLMKQRLSLLHPVLEVPVSIADPTRLLHPSFRDFPSCRQKMS